MNLQQGLITFFLLASFSNNSLAKTDINSYLNRLAEPVSQEQYQFNVTTLKNIIYQEITVKKINESLNQLEKLSDEQLIQFDDVIQDLSDISSNYKLIALRKRIDEIRIKQNDELKKQYSMRQHRSNEVKIIDLTYDQIDSLELTGSKFPEKTILLTFDDGPHGQRTKVILDSLAKYNIPATFFTIGSSLAANLKDENNEEISGLEIAQSILEQGHTLATHTWNHPNLARTNYESGKKNVDKAIKYVISNLDYFPHYFRFPYGAKNKSLIKYMNGHDYSLDITNGPNEMTGIKSIYWHMDSNDWKTKNPQTLVKNCLKIFSTYKKGVFLMHDIHPQTAIAFPILLDYLVDDGWTFVRLVN